MQSGQDAVVAGISSDLDVHELTRRRAEEIYVRNGRIPGRDIENWTRAEEEIRAELERASTREAADDYTPGEFELGAPVPVRLDGDRMFVKRPNGKVLETRIVQQVG